MKTERLVKILSSTPLDQSSRGIETKIEGFNKLATYVVTLKIIHLEKLTGNSRLMSGANYISELELLKDLPKVNNTLMIDATSKENAEKEAIRSELEKLSRRLLLLRIRTLSENPLMVEVVL